MVRPFSLARPQFSSYGLTVANRILDAWKNIGGGGGGSSLSGTLHLYGRLEINNLGTDHVAYDPSSESWVALAGNSQDGAIQGYYDPTDDLFYGIRENLYFSYDPVADTWVSLSNLPEPRDRDAIQRIGDTLYLCFGVSGSSSRKNVVWYNTSTGTWSGPSGDIFPDWVGSQGSGVANGKILTFGGSHGTNYRTYCGYVDPSGPTYTAKASLPAALEPAASGTTEDGLIWAVTGKNGSSSWSDAVYVYDPETDTWDTKTPMPKVLTDTIGCFNGDRFHVASVSTLEHYYYIPAEDTWYIGPDLPSLGTNSVATLVMWGQHSLDTSSF